MKHTKEEKASYLLDEVGGVRDTLLQEALTYRPKKRYGWILPLTAGATVAAGSIAAVLLAVLICLPILWNLILPALQKNEAPSAGGDAPNAVESSLDAVLSQAVAYRTPASAEEIDYFAGVSLVWENADGTLAQSRPLTQAETTRIRSLIGKGTPVGAASPDITRVWLVMDNGDVLSPYLPNTAGNIGAATLFDYQAELLPSKDLISCISDILGQN